jgi:tRNA(Ile2) C34 agmatinyltransferase TiaS
MNEVVTMAMREKRPITRTQTVTITRQVTLEEKVCPQCGKKFFGRKNQKFCSRACVQKDSYDRHAEARRATRREKYQAEKRMAAGKRRSAS